MNTEISRARLISPPDVPYTKELTFMATARPATAKSAGTSARAAGKKAVPQSGKLDDGAAMPPLFGVVVLAALVVICVGLQQVQSIVGPVFLVLTLVITVQPVRSYLVERKVPSPVASIAALLAVYGLLAVVLGSVVWSLSELVVQLPKYAPAFTNMYNHVLTFLAQFGIDTAELRRLASTINLSTFTGVAQSLLNTVTSGVSLLALMLAMVFFLTFDAAGMGDRIDLVRRTRPQIADAFIDFAASVRKYWVVTTVFGLIVAVIDVVGLLIIGVPLAVTWGVLAFVTNYIPNIGFLLGLIPPVLIALLEDGPGSAVAVIIVYCAINVIIQTLIQPRFTGDAVGITATVAFLSLIFWSFILGALGALLAVPATLLVKALLVDHSKNGQWVGAIITASPKGLAKTKK